MTTAQRRLYREAIAGAEDAAGGRRALQIIGSTYRRALVAAEILRLCYLQDDEIVSDAAVRRMLTELTAQLRDDEAL